MKRTTTLALSALLLSSGTLARGEERAQAPLSGEVRAAQTAPESRPAAAPAGEEAGEHRHEAPQPGGSAAPS